MAPEVASTFVRCVPILRITVVLGIALYSAACAVQPTIGVDEHKRVDVLDRVDGSEPSFDAESHWPPGKALRCQMIRWWLAGHEEGTEIQAQPLCLSREKQLGIIEYPAGNETITQERLSIKITLPGHGKERAFRDWNGKAFFHMFGLMSAALKNDSRSQPESVGVAFDSDKRPHHWRLTTARNFCDIAESAGNLWEDERCFEPLEDIYLMEYPLGHRLHHSRTHGEGFIDALTTRGVHVVSEPELQTILYANQLLLPVRGSSNSVLLRMSPESSRTPVFASLIGQDCIWEDEDSEVHRQVCVPDDIE